MAGVWMVDPDDSSMECYFDGEAWTQLRRRKPTPAVQAPAADPLDLGAPRDFMAEAKVKVRESTERARIKAQEQPTTCLSEGCNQPRVDGFFQCRTHYEFLVEHGHKPWPVPATPQPVPQGSGQLVCPHCQTRGRVTRRRVKQKKGVSGGKATGAVLTGGLSLFATGLSRKEKSTEMHCGNCGTTWHV